MGVRIAATLVVIGLGILIIYFALRPDPSEEVGVIPTVESSQGEEEPEVAGTLPIATFTPGPTSTPPPLDEPTPGPDATVAEGPAGEIAVGASVTVTGTGTDGLSLRAESNTTADRIAILPDGTPLTIVEGPTEGESFTWWKVRTEAGQEGWVAQDFLAP
jgi:hypothetical protein